jgi:hypothetical protein
MLHDPFNRSALPAVASASKDSFGREVRVALLAEFFGELMAGRMPRRECVVFAAGGAVDWLEQGGTVGSLERDYWKVSAPHRSTMTPSRIWKLSSRREQDAEACDTVRG